MKKGTLIWTFFPPLLMILITSLLLVTGFSGRAMRGFFMDRTELELENLAQVAAPRFAPLITAGDEDRIQALCRELGEISRIRFTVMLADGRVVGDSQELPAVMDDHSDRPEMMRAIAGVTGTSTRFSATLGHPRMYVAVPVTASTTGGTAFVVRTSVSLDSQGELIRGVYLKIALIGLLLALLASLTSYLLSRSLSRALGRLQAGAAGFAEGRLDQHLLVADTTEIAAVAEAMNNMAHQLGDRIRTIETQRNELQAVLASMVEGVLAIDPDEHVINMNQACARLLDQNVERALGRSIQEVGRNSELTRLAQETLTEQGPLERDMMLSSAGNRWVQVHATGLLRSDGSPLGALLVMNDITRIRRLENMRRDFVANVSHELKTPITSIKGYVETLIEAPPEDRAEFARFLTIINRQADRLDSIITDLLALSRLEKDSDNGGIDRQPASLQPLLERIVRDRADADRVQLDCPAPLQAAVNAPLFEQAVNNLLENALKYSPAASAVTITCEAAGDQVLIRVADRGCGIAAEHLPRLFERFYRVDKARSRQMGGTGLGLAIVKHIAQAHKGHVTVDSTPGEGSVFTIHLNNEVSP
jgi:two-component system phosphate regulon sensor histidine kinase PhoR